MNKDNALNYLPNDEFNIMNSFQASPSLTDHAEAIKRIRTPIFGNIYFNNNNNNYNNKESKEKNDNRNKFEIGKEIFPNLNSSNKINNNILMIDNERNGDLEIQREEEIKNQNNSEFTSHEQAQFFPNIIIDSVKGMERVEKLKQELKDFQIKTESGKRELELSNFDKKNFKHRFKNEFNQLKLNYGSDSKGLLEESTSNNVSNKVQKLDRQNALTSSFQRGLQIDKIQNDLLKNTPQLNNKKLNEISDFEYKTNQNQYMMNDKVLITDLAFPVIPEFFPSSSNSKITSKYDQIHLISKKYN